MPRKKTVQPPPLESFIIDDTTIELRDHTCRLLGRGLHKRHEFEEWRHKVAQWVIPQYLDNNGRKQLKTQDDFLVSANKFSATLSNKRPDLYPISGDDSSVRKRLYPYLIKEILVLTRAIDEVKRKGTSQAQR
jgi:hypothetical protein